jgi:two-component system, chemotaxis family, CheB/CheR fusion protein
MSLWGAESAYIVRSGAGAGLGFVNITNTAEQMRQNQQRPKRTKAAKTGDTSPSRGKKHPQPAPKKSFPVAGIGASAGGLEAFTALLKHLPVDTGMAFVVVQHLSPTHDGILPTLLAKTTKMPVLEVSNGMKVEPNHVYVIPPNASMAITDGSLKLLPRQMTQGQTRSIDFFFQSLAEARGHESVGIILSGTASDGTLGLEAIKAEGGITFAQDESAKFDSMPRSAIAAGCVDFVMSPPGIARELARLAHHPYVALPRAAATDEGELIDPGDDFKKVLAIVRRSSGNDFNAYKSATLQRRLHRRMVLGKFKNLAEYVTYLTTHPAEVEALTADFLIGVTNFFRDPAAFEFLKRRVFPKLLKAHQSRPADEALRFWVLGCSTGQEAYSLAMAWLEFAGPAHTSLALQIFATDVHNPYLERARAGLYSKSLLQDLSPERLRRFFVEVDGGYRVNKLVRDMCVFAKQNVVSDPPFSHIDLVSCRNLLIYLRPELQKKVIPIFHFALKPAGYLFLGPAETVTGFGQLFASIDPKMKVFVRKPGPARVDTRFSPSPLPFPKARETARAAASEPVAGVDPQREADRLMLTKYAPAGVLINANLEVLQFRGSTGRYLEAPAGKATLNVLKMAREGLFSPLRSAIKKAGKDNTAVRTSGISIKENGRSFVLNLEVIPLKQPNEEERCFLVNFEPPPESVSEPGPRKAPRLAPRAQKGSVTETAHVRRELAETKEHLQSVIEQQDAYNEELQSANEEAQAANEELQSINEEMETAKEELQASNEELTTVNEELNARNHQMALTTNDLTNLLGSVHMPIVMLGRDFCIRRFTAQAEKILSLASTDVGRSIIDLNLKVPIPDLEQSLTQVIETVTSKEQEIQDRQGHWYALRIRPYMTGDNKIDGAVMLLVDVDELKRNEREISEARDYAQHIVETVGDALLVLDQTLIVQSANHSFYEMFRVSPQETEKRYIYSLGTGEWNIPELRKLLEEILPQNREIHDFEVEQDFPRIGHRILQLNARRFPLSSSHRELILLAISDVTARHLAERKVHRSECVIGGSSKRPGTASSFLRPPREKSPMPIRSCWSCSIARARNCWGRNSGRLGCSGTGRTMKPPCASCRAIELFAASTFRSRAGAARRGMWKWLPTSIARMGTRSSNATFATSRSAKGRRKPCAKAKNAIAPCSTSVPWPSIPLIRRA